MQIKEFRILKLNFVLLIMNYNNFFLNESIYEGKTGWIQG